MGTSKKKPDVDHTVGNTIGCGVYIAIGILLMMILADACQGCMNICMGGSWN